MLNGYARSTAYGGFRLAASLGTLLALAALDFSLGHFKRTHHPFYPRFVGLHLFDHHEFFDPQYEDRRKIAVLGPSFVATWFCDGRGIVDPFDRCSISTALSAELRSRGDSSFKSFNLGIDGGKFIPLLGALMSALPAHPDIVVIGLSSYLFYNQSGRDEFEPLFSPTWKLGSEALEDSPLLPEWKTLMQASPYFHPEAGREARRFEFTGIRKAFELPAILQETLTYQAGLFLARFWDPLQIQDVPYESANVVPTFDVEDQLFLVDVLAELSRRYRFKTMVYHTPLRWLQGNADYQKRYRAPIADAFRKHPEILYRDWSDYPLIPGREAVVGDHNTYRGNQRIARLIYGELKEAGWLNR